MARSMRIPCVSPALEDGRIETYVQSNKDKGMKSSRASSTLIGAFALFALMLGTLPPSSHADDVDRVRELRSTDSILPLSQILRVVEKRHPGTLLEVELEEEEGQIIYEMEILGKDKVVRQLKIDARTGKILDTDKDD